VADPLTAAGLRQFSQIARDFAASGDPPGLVVLAARGDQAYLEALGSMRAGGPPMPADTIFRISSMTKPVTAAATLALAGEGLFSLDEPIDRLLPELADRPVLLRMDGPLDETVPAERPVTVRDLLSFTAGFGATAGILTFPNRFPVVLAANELHLAPFGPPDPLGPPDADTWIARLGTLPLMSQPGERFLYHTPAQMLGVLLARAAGQSFADVMRTRIFEPLGMADSGFSVTEPDRLAPVHYRAGKRGLLVFEDWEMVGEPTFYDGAAGLVTTAADLLAFSRMLLRGGEPVLSPQAVAEMTSEQVPPEVKDRVTLGKGFFYQRGWGYGFFVMNEGPNKGAYGAGGFFGTSWLVNPALDLTMIVLSQRLIDRGRFPDAHTDLQNAATRAATESAQDTSARSRLAPAPTSGGEES
jgi:CubicO group peptidase (beta-lactamase class C family)